METTFLQERVLSTRIMNTLSKPLVRMNISLPSWILIIVAESLIIMLHVGAWKLVYPQAKFDWWAFAWIYWGALIAGIIAIFVDQNIDFFFTNHK